MLSRKQKKEIIKELVQKLRASKAVVFTDFSPPDSKGLTVIQMEELRHLLREEGIDYKVAKKTLVNLALKKAGLRKVDVDQFQGSLALAFSREDEIMPAKILYRFSRKNPALFILGGLVGPEYLDRESVIALAKIPSREELIVRVVGSIRAPISRLVNVTSAPLRDILFVFQGVAAST